MSKLLLSKLLCVHVPVICFVEAGKVPVADIRWYNIYCSMCHLQCMYVALHDTFYPSHVKGKKCHEATRAKLCKCCQGQTPQNFDRVLAAACLYRDMLSCQPHLSESAMMAQHSDVGRRRRLQKPYPHYVRAPTRWPLQEITRDHLGRALQQVTCGSSTVRAVIR